MKADDGDNEDESHLSVASPSIRSGCVRLYEASPLAWWWWLPYRGSRKWQQKLCCVLFSFCSQERLIDSMSIWWLPGESEWSQGGGGGFFSLEMNGLKDSIPYLDSISKVNLKRIFFLLKLSNDSIAISRLLFIAGYFFLLYSSTDDVYTVFPLSFFLLGSVFVYQLWRLNHRRKKLGRTVARLFILLKASFLQEKKRKKFFWCLLYVWSTLKECVWVGASKKVVLF